MNKDQIKGRVKEAMGTMQKHAGKAVDSPEQQGKGAAQEHTGKAQKTWGNLKEGVRQAREDMRPRTGGATRSR